VGSTTDGIELHDCVAMRPGLERRRPKTGGKPTRRITAIIRVGDLDNDLYCSICEIVSLVAHDAKSA
jgi:hypothetical protein